MSTAPALPWTIDDVINGVRIAYLTKMPEDLQAEVEALYAHHPAETKALLSQVIAVVGFWMSEASKHTTEIVAEQVALQQAQLGLAMVAKGMKARRGEKLDAGRFALAAFHVATVANGIESEPLNLAGADKLLDQLKTPIEIERDRLRELIEEIADMDLGDPEGEHRDIVDRCRAEMKRWEDE